MSNVVRALWLGYWIHHPHDTVTTKWDTPGPTWLISWHSELRVRVRPHNVNIQCSPSLHIFSSATEVNSKLKVYKTRHLHVHELLPCHKTCWGARKLLTDPLRCKFQVNWKCSTSPVSVPLCSASERQGQNTTHIAFDITRDEMKEGWATTYNSSSGNHSSYGLSYKLDLKSIGSSYDLVCIWIDSRLSQYSVTISNLYIHIFIFSQYHSQCNIIPSLSVLQLPKCSKNWHWEYSYSKKVLPEPLWEWSTQHTQTLWNPELLMNPKVVKANKHWHSKVLVSFSDEEIWNCMELLARKWNCKQAHWTIWKSMYLYASSWNCMQAHGTACKLMKLHANSWIFM